MSSSSTTDSKQESLSESWIDFTRTKSTVQTEAPSCELVASSSSPVKMTPVSSKTLEKLLLEAQRESSYASSRIDSLTSSRASPHSQRSPTNDQPATSSPLDDPRLPREIEGDDEEVAGKWVWDWSSRPEVVPPSSLQFKHPVTMKRSLSIRNTRIMRGIVFSLENLPLLIFTHACTFLLGAASMVFYLKKFSHWSAASSSSMNY